MSSRDHSPAAEPTHSLPSTGAAGELPGGVPDEQIVAQVLAGDLQAFELLMRRNNQRLFRAVRAILRSESETEDVVQDAYVRAFSHLAEFKGEARFSTWLTRIAVHEALARVRKARRLKALDPQEQGAAVMSNASHSPEQHASDAEIRIVLDRAIDALPDEFRLVFVLRAVEQMSGSETAAVLGIPEQTVKTRLYRARERLQRNVLDSLGTHVPSAYDFHLSRCDRVVSAVMARLSALTSAPKGA